MRAVIEPHCFSGTVRVPASKSHTIRRLLIAALGAEIDERRAVRAGGVAGGLPRRGGSGSPQGWSAGGDFPLPDHAFAPASTGAIKLEGHGDHRVVMALAALALAAGPAEISTAESAAVTYPGFLELLGAEMAE